MSIATEIQRLQTAKADIKTAIENKGVTVGDGTIDTYAKKIGEIEVGGDVVQVERYMKEIRFATWDFGTPNLVLNLDSATTLDNLFYNITNNTVEHLTINCPNENLYAFQYMLWNNYVHENKVLKRLTLNCISKNTGIWYGAFTYCSALEIIDGIPLNLSASTKNSAIFDYCNALREVRFDANSIKVNISFSHSPNLSAETIQSIIDGLADLTGGTAQTLTFHATVGAKLTDTQKATITAKNWTLVY